MQYNIYCIVIYYNRCSIVHEILYVYGCKFLLNYFPNKKEIKKFFIIKKNLCKKYIQQKYSMLTSELAWDCFIGIDNSLSPLIRA